MPQYRLITQKLLQVGDDNDTVVKSLFHIIFDGQRTPFKVVDVASIAALQSEIDTFAEELKSSNLPWLVDVGPCRGVRKFRGFDKTDFKRYVNIHLLPENKNEEFVWTGDESFVTDYNNLANRQPAT